MNQQQITTQELFAIIGEKDVQLAVARGALTQMAETVKRLGPLGLPRRFAEWDREMTHLEAEVAAHAAREPMPSSVMRSTRK